MKPDSPIKASRVCSAFIFAAVLAVAGGSRQANAASATPPDASATANVSSASGQPAIACASKPGGPWENSLGMKFVPVPGADVLFCIWETRVQDYDAFVKAANHNAGEGWRDPESITRGFNLDSGAVFTQTPLHPVTHVNWNDAVAFCRWLTEKERVAGKLSAGQEFRLPTDDEWSRAVGLPAESGATPEEKDGKIGNVYPWGVGYPPPKGSGNYLGEDDGEDSWSGKIEGYADGAKFTAKVGSYAANRLGIHDLGGNVWEWCSDWYNAEQETRVIRGASFVQGGPRVLLSSCHSRQPPGVRDRRFGFRCVLTVGRPRHEVAAPLPLVH